MKSLSLVVPIKTASTANLREHWAQKHNRTDAQKAATRRQLDKLERPDPLLAVRLTRVSPRPLDDDNLRGALKSVRDAVATWLRVDDRTCLVRWDYAQEKGEPSVRVEVEVMPEPRIRVSLEPAANDAPSATRWSERNPPPVASKGARLINADLAALATPNVRRPLVPPVCVFCTNGNHERTHLGECACLCHQRGEP